MKTKRKGEPREPGVFCARPLSSRLEFVDRALRKPSRKQFKSRSSSYKSKHKGYRAIVQRAKQRFGARLPPPPDYTSVDRNADSHSQHLSMFNANYLHVFHQDLDKVVPIPSATSAQANISPTAVALPVNRNESAGATWAIDKTKQLDLMVEDSHTADPQNSCIPRRSPQQSELPVLRNLDLHLSYNSTGAKYDPCPSWLRDEDENQMLDNSTPNQSWINGSGIPVHPPRKIPEGMINRFQDLDLATYNDLYASIPDTVSSPPKPTKKAKRKKLRPVIIDGNNVALWHGNQAIFSARGIQTCIDFFKHRGHPTVTVYVPDLKSSNAAVLNSEVLEKLEKDGVLKYTPVASHVNRKGVRVISQDNRKLILQKAVENGAVIISNENYQELFEDARETWRERLSNGILQFDFDSPKTIALKTDHKQKKTVDELLLH